MPVIVDGNNVLGAARLAAEAKRQLVRDLARYARAKRTKVVCVFDGAEPESFGKQLGAVSVVFSGAGAADEVIARRTAAGAGWRVVTGDRGLAARVGGRRVEVVDPRRFVAEIEALPAGEERAVADDWISYFSDPKNRNIF
jgi:predicted RNA-binding protein with PIN domain